MTLKPAPRATSLSRLSENLKIGIAALTVPAVLYGGSAFAQTTQDGVTTIDNDIETPQRTSEAGDILIEDGGSITVQEGTIITIDSDATVTLDDSADLEGEAFLNNEPDFVQDPDRDPTLPPEDTDELEGADGVTAVLVTNDVDFTYVQEGDILIDDERFPDGNSAGFVDYANDRFGFRMVAGSYSGEITLTEDARITLRGDESAGMSLEGDFDGSISIDGDIDVDGSDSFGVFIGGDVTGNIDFLEDSSISTFGERSDGIRVDGDVGGRFYLEGSVSVQGFTDATPDLEDDEDLNDEEREEAIRENNEQRQLVSGDGVVITGDVDGGVLLDGFLPAEYAFQEDYIERLDDDDDEDDDDFDDLEADRNSSISVTGSGTALVIDGGSAGLTIGQITEEDLVRDLSNDRDDDDDPDNDTVTGVDDLTAEELAGEGLYGEYGFINRGSIFAAGTYDGIHGSAAYIANTTIESGMRNDGTIDATAREAGTTGLHLGDGFSTDEFINGGRIRATSTGTNISETSDGLAQALYIEQGATLTSITNTGFSRIEAVNNSDTDGAYAIRDESGTVTSLTNAGTIRAVVTEDRENDDIDEDGDGIADVQLAETGRDAIAIDFSANSSGVEVYNTVYEFFDEDDFDREDFGNVEGDVYLGTGDDIYRADAGLTEGDIYLSAGFDQVILSQEAEIEGDIDFGEGDSLFSLDNATVTGDIDYGTGSHDVVLANGAIYEGAVTSSSSDWDLTVDGSSFTFANGGETLNVGNVEVFSSGESAGNLGFTIAADGNSVSSISAQSVTIEDGSIISTSFEGAFVSATDSALTDTIIEAGNLDVDVSTIELNQEGVNPVLFDQALLQADEGAPIVLSYRRRTGEELEISDELIGAYEPAIVALNEDQEMGAVVFNANTLEDFHELYDQLIAGPLDAPLAYTRAQNSAVTSIITQRVELLGDNSGERLAKTFWMQQEGYFLDRAEEEGSNGFDGGGFVLAAGADTPFRGLDVVGASVHLASARYDEKLGEDFPFNRLTYGVDVYAAEDFGAVEVDGRVGFGIASSDSERFLVFEDEQRTVDGEWEGTQVTANGRVRYRSQLGKYELVPFVSTDYVSLTEDAYTETGDTSLAIEAQEREAQSLRGNVGMSVGRVIQLRPNTFDTSIPGTIVPRLTAAYSHEFITDDLEATYNFIGGEQFTLTSEAEAYSGIIGADVDYENEYAKIHVGASGIFGERTNIYAVRIGVGLKW